MRRIRRSRRGMVRLYVLCPRMVDLGSRSERYRLSVRRGIVDRISSRRCRLSRRRVRQVVLSGRSWWWCSRRVSVDVVRRVPVDVKRLPLARGSPSALLALFLVSSVTIPNALTHFEVHLVPIALPSSLDSVPPVMTFYVLPSTTIVAADHVRVVVLRRVSTHSKPSRSS